MKVIDPNKLPTDILNMFGAELGNPTSFYLRRRKRGTEMWIKYSGGLHYNLSISTNKWPASFAEARRLIAEYGITGEIGKRRKPKLTLIKGKI